MSAQLGGLSKKAFQLNRLRENSGRPVLVLDSGNLLFKPWPLTGARLDQARIAASGIVQAYNLMHFDAVAVGSIDLAGGLDFLLDLDQQAAFPWLSANLVRRSDASPLFRPYTIINRGGLTVGVIGITADNARPQPVLPAEVVIRPWRRVLPETVAKLKDKCDLVILLSNYSLAENRAIANSVADIGLILQSSPSPANLVPTVVKNTLICRTGKQGKYLGWLRINQQKAGQWESDDLQKIINEKKQELAGINNQMNRLRNELGPEEVAGHQGYAGLETYREQMLASIRELEQESEKRQQEGPAPAGFSNSYISMATSLPDQPEVLALVKRIKADISRAGQRASRAKTATPAGQSGKKPGNRLDQYTGWPACGQCHPQQAAFWQTTRHGTAYQTLVAQQQQFNLDCLTCHVTPALTDQGQSLLTLPRPLRSVGCETCHGPDRGHGNQPAAVPLARQPAEEICRRCHTPDHDQNFNYLEKRALISCPKQESMKQAD